jgi:hypothetical protein
MINLKISQNQSQNQRNKIAQRIKISSKKSQKSLHSRKSSQKSLVSRKSSKNGKLTGDNKIQEFKIGKEDDVQSDHENFSDNSSEDGGKKYDEKYLEKAKVVEEKSHTIQEFKIGDQASDDDYEDGFSSSGKDEKPIKQTSLKEKKVIKKATTKTSKDSPVEVKTKKAIAKSPNKKQTKTSESPVRQKTETKAKDKITSNTKQVIKTATKSKAQKSSIPSAKLNQDLMSISKPDEFKIDDQYQPNTPDSDDEIKSSIYSSKKANVNSEIDESINEEYGSIKENRGKATESRFPDLNDGSAPEPKINEFKINDQVSEESFGKFEDEKTESVQNSVYESIEKSTRLKDMADKKYGAKERPKQETESSISEDYAKSVTKSITKPVTKPPKDKKIVKETLKRSETNLNSHRSRGVNMIEPNEFKISDVGSNIRYEGFSESEYICVNIV